METESLDLPHPRSAWLLLGDEASYPPVGLYGDTDEEYWCWTVCPHVEIGDTLFFYFLAPRKAIHFIGRAVSRPYVDPNLEVTSNRNVNRHQWWVDYDAVVEVEPIPLKEINRACGERLVMRGRSGKYIRSEAANHLLKRARITYSSEPWCGDMAFQRIVGGSELPAPSDMDLKTLRDLPSSLLRLESDVEEYIVEPLFRLLRLPQVYRIQRRLRIGRKVADYAVLNRVDPRCIVEVKLRTSLDGDRHWGDSPDVQQAQGYADSFGIGFVVVDCDEVFCFDAGSSVPRLHFERRELTNKELTAIRSFVIASD